MIEKKDHSSCNIDDFPRHEISDPTVLSRTPLVSVKMVTYNHELYIAQAIEGVLIQETEFPIELIIGEDCSTDRTREIVLDYQKQYPNLIRVLISTENVGAARNDVLTYNACRGTYVAVCDGDDYWTDSSKLQKQVDFLDANPEYAMSGHAAKTIFLGDIAERERFHKPLKIATFDDLLEYHFLPSLSMVFRKRLISKHPSWFLNVGSGDIAMELMLAHHGKIYYMDDIMGIKRVHSGGISQTLHKRQGKKARLENSLYLYDNLNKHCHYEHNSSLSKIIARTLLSLAKIELNEKNYYYGTMRCIQAVCANPKVVLGKSLSFLFGHE